jgi:hypothetical protein
MLRTQIYLTERQRNALRRLAKRTGMTQSQIIRTAVDRWLEQNSCKPRKQMLENIAGMWRDRPDLPDFAALRREANRVPLAADYKISHN